LFLILGSVSRRRQPALFNNHGSDTSIFRNNLIERGGATNATQASVVTGKFKLTGNHIAGFDEKDGMTTLPAKRN